VTVSGLDAFGFKQPAGTTNAYIPLGFPASGTNYCKVDGGSASAMHTATGGSLGLIPQMVYQKNATDNK
jgi:putative hemolysin